MSAQTLQLEVTTSIAPLSATSIPNKNGIEVKALAENSAPVYFGYSDRQILQYSAGYVPTGGTFNLTIRDAVGTPFTAYGLAYNIAAAALQTAIRALSANFSAFTVSGTSPLIADSGLTISTNRQQFPLVTTNVAGVTGGTPGTLPATYSSSLTTGNGFQIDANQSYRFLASDAIDANGIWLVAASDQTVCASLS